MSSRNIGIPLEPSSAKLLLHAVYIVSIIVLMISPYWTVLVLSDLVK